MTVSDPTDPIDKAAPPESDALLTLDQLCSACAVQTEFVLTLLEEGVTQPQQGQQPETWRFNEVQVHRVSVAWRLHRDLGVNPAGAALALQLLDEVETLRAQLAAADPGDAPLTGDALSRL